MSKKTIPLLGLLTVLFIVCGTSCDSRPPIETVSPPQEEKEPSEHEEETEHFHETSKELKLFPPLTEKEAEYYQRLFKDTHVEIQLAAASVLMSHGDRSGEQVLLELLKGENQHLRIDSFLKLAERPTKKLIPDLQRAIEAEKDTMARFVMKRALKKAQQRLKEYEEEAPTEIPD